MKKEAKYIDDCKEILNGMWDGKSELDNNKNSLLEPFNI